MGYGLTPYDDVLGLAHHQAANSWENRNNGVSGGAGFGQSQTNVLGGGGNGLFTNFNGQASTNTTAFDARYTNSFSYKTPDWKGFSLRTQYALINQSAYNNDKAWGWDTAAIYMNGPFVGGLTYAYHSNFSGMGAGGNTPQPTIVGGINNQNALRGYASWNFGMFKIDGTIEGAKYKFDNAPANLNLNQSYKFFYYDIGVLAPWQAWTFGAQYSNRDKGLAMAYNASTNTYAPTPAMLSQWDTGGGKHWSLTADYNLSKRTAIRMYYSWMRNEGTWNTSPTATGNLMIGNSKVTALSAGLWHSF
jgi:predicted porin